MDKLRNNRPSPTSQFDNDNHCARSSDGGKENHPPRRAKRVGKNLSPFESNYPTYKLVTNTMSLFIAALAASSCWYKSTLPMMRDAVMTSWQACSSRTMVRTMLPSLTSVSVHMSLKGVPRAHSHTTCNNKHPSHGHCDLRSSKIHPHTHTHTLCVSIVTHIICVNCLVVTHRHVKCAPKWASF